VVAFRIAFVILLCSKIVDEFSSRLLFLWHTELIALTYVASIDVICHRKPVDTGDSLEH